MTPAHTATSSDPPARIRVLICDDDPVVRRALLQYLAPAADIEVVAAVDSAEAAQPWLLKEVVDVLLLDVRMPGMGGVELAEWAYELPAPPKILFLSSLHDDRTVRLVSTGRALGTLTKELSPHALVEAVRAAQHQVRVLSATAADRLGTLTMARDEVAENLSERDVELLGLICAGETNPEIARSLYLSESSVKSQINSLMERTGQRSRVTLALWAARQGVI